MIGADTNVVIRMFVEDYPPHTRAARFLIESKERENDPILITAVVFAEVEWSLRSNFGFTKADIVEVFVNILSNAGFQVDEREAVDAALESWRDGRADFADYLIGALARQRGARTTMTFDRKAAASEAFTLLPDR